MSNDARDSEHTEHVDDVTLANTDAVDLGVSYQLISIHQGNLEMAAPCDIIRRCQTM